METNKELAAKLEDYITELDHLVDRMNSCGFPFGDTVMVYEEVSNRLKQLMAK